MKIVISGYYGFDNSGDDALLMSIIDNLKKNDEKAEITVLSKNPQQTKRQYGVGAANRYNPFSLIKTIATCDLLISGGGTLIQDATSTKSLFYYLFVIKLAQIFRKKVMLYANGIGPLNSFKNIENTQKILDNVDLITLRDPKSREELEKIGVTKPKIELTADPAFLIEANESGKSVLETYGVPSDKPLMCVSVRQWKNNPENFEEIMAKFCDYAADKYGLFTVFLTMQHKVDFAIASNIKEKMRNKSVVVGANYPVETILSVMDQMTVSVGMRLHTLIYSASRMIPLIGIVYDPKINGFLEYLGDNRYTMVEDLSYDALCKNLDYVKENYDTICSGLKYHIRSLKSKAEENGKLLSQLLYGGDE